MKKELSRKALEKTMNDTSFRPWKILKSQEIFADEPWVKLTTQQVLLPNGKIIDNYYQIKTGDFAIIVARTPSGEMILERHYRHGVRKVTYTLPAGGIEKDEEALAAAKRELREETGYSSDDWQKLGSFISSANYGCSTAHIFVANKARKIVEPHSGDLEEMVVLCLKPEEVIDLVRLGEISALSSVAAIGLALNPSFKREEAVR